MLDEDDDLPGVSWPVYDTYMRHFDERIAELARHHDGILAELKAVGDLRREYGNAVYEAWELLRSVPAATSREFRGVVRCETCRSALVKAWPIGDRVFIMPTKPRPHPEPDDNDYAHRDEDDRYWFRSLDARESFPWPAWSLRGHPLDPAWDTYDCRCRCVAYEPVRVPWTEIELSLRVRGREVIHRRATPNTGTSA